MRPIKAIFKSKAFATFAAVAVCATTFALGIAFAVREERDLGARGFVATDMHVVANSRLEKMSERELDECRNADKLLLYSDAIFNTFADNLVRERAEFLLLCGDLTQYGDEESHNAVIRVLRRLTKNGVKVFVANGNHDVAMSESSEAASGKRFHTLYRDFGYGRAADEYSDKLSYVADLSEDARVLAVDNIGHCDSERKKEEMSTEHKYWIMREVEKNFNDGKKTIVIAHKPFMNHFPQISDYFSESQNDRELSEFFAKHGAEHVFVGHKHFNHIREKKYKGGNSVKEILTGCLAAHPAPFREIRIRRDGISVKTRRVNAINPKYIAKCLKKSEYMPVANDLSKASETAFKKRVNSQYLDGIGVKGGPLDFESEAEARPELKKYLPLYDALIGCAKRCLDAPYRKADESIPGVSMESILEKYGLELPDTEYGCFRDYFFDSGIEALCGEGDFADENFRDLFRRTIFEFMHFVKEDEGRINAEIGKLGLKDGSGADLRLSLDMDAAKSGKIDCYSSGLMPLVIGVAPGILGAAFPGNKIADFLVVLLPGFLTDLKGLKDNSVIEKAAKTYGILEGYGAYILDDCRTIDFDGLFFDLVLDPIIEEFAVQLSLERADSI